MMNFSRAASTLRSGLRFAQTARPTSAPTWRVAARRGYASGGHGSAKAGSDLPWAIGGVAITVPTCYYILSSSPEEHHDSHGLHGRSHDVEERQGGEQSSSSSDDSDSDSDKSSESDSESSSEDKSEDKSNDSEDSDDESKGTQKPAGDEERVTKSAEEGETNETRKHIPDAKGGNKKRVESGRSITQGAVADENDTEGSPDDTPAASKEAGNLNHTQSGKQEGLSNTDTKHSYDIQNNPDKSKKGEGTPETSKTKGTVDVNRPQV